MNKTHLLRQVLKHKVTLTPFLGSIIIILLGAIIFPQFLNTAYLLQQLRISSFLGVIAIGAILVIFLGHIDLSVPWVFTGAAIISTTLNGTNIPVLQFLALPLALLFGAFIGSINGIGVAILRIPSMVWTLAINSMLFGIAVLNTGGHNPQGQSSELMKYLAKSFFLGIPTAFWVWIGLSTMLFVIIKKTPFGNYLSAIGYCEKATFLSGVKTTKIVFIVFTLAGVFSALGGILLAGYADQAYQSMGDPYLMPVIAAVVIGGTSILGGKGSFIGMIGGVIFITLLTSILSVIQISEAWRLIIFGTIIIVMLLAQREKQKLL